MRRAWGLVLAVGLVGLLGCGDSDGGNDGSNKPVGDDDAGMDAGKRPPKKDSGPGEMDSGMDAGPTPTDAGPDGYIFVRDGSWADALIMLPSDAEVSCIFNKPAEWTCPDSFWDDGVCDCGCSALDSCDCNQYSCTTPGCVEPTCGACNAADGTSMACEPPPDQNDWSCASGNLFDTLCDCGCGYPDGACGGSGCTASSCYRPYCDRRWDTSGASPAQITTNPYIAGWQTCALGSYGEGAPNSCDCGCGIHDADCDALLDCTTAGCNAVGCNVCHDTTGRVVPCDTWVSAWVGNANNSASCDPVHYNEGDGVCDCGCGAVDPDCTPGSGTIGGAGAFAAECDRCFNTAGDQVGCNPPAGWTCYDQYYGTGDGCDCECGAADPDCAGNGCADPGCSDGNGSACAYCWTDKDNPRQCGNGKWTCTTGDSVNAWTSTSTCDCGCGTPDPACRFGGRPDCVGSDCGAIPGCEMCNDGAGGRVSCGGQWTANNCNLDYYGDGHCDCGCGAPDPDCGTQGCTAKGCVAAGCEVCHQGAALIPCETWHCAASEYDDGTDTCDCGCGAMDPDCPAGQGCKEPGCHRKVSDTETCDVCHDGFGRVVPCPT